MDFHFSSDLLVFAGFSKDYYFNLNNPPNWNDIPIVAAMSIAEQFYIWTISAHEWDN
jgi:hypothetical protein